MSPIPASMNPKRLSDNFAELRARPLRFVLLVGVFAWGVPVAFLWSTAMSHATDLGFVHWFTPAIVGFPLGGVVLGLFFRRT
jgi:hypothetical protein